MPTVNVISPEGQTVAIPEESLAGALTSGFKLETGAAAVGRAVNDYKREAYDGVAGTALAGTAGFARGATLGLSDVALGAAGGGEFFGDLKEYNPTVSFVGEIGGALATALPTGGQSLLGRAPAGLASRAGLATTEAIQAGGGAARSIAGYAAGGAVEGAAQGAGSYISDVALGDRKLSAEGFLGAMGSGALWGGAIGGGLGAAERGFVAARKLWPKSEVTREAVQAAQADATTATNRALAAGDEAEMAAKRKIQEMRAGNPAADEAARNAADEWRARQASAATRTAEARAASAEQKLATQRELDAIKLERAKNPGKRKAAGTPPEGVPAVDGPTPGVAGEVPPGAAVDVPGAGTVAADATPGATPGGMAADAAKPVPMAATIEEAMEDAMAAVDPEIGKLVRARRDYVFGKSQLPRLDGEMGASGRAWKVRGHQGDGVEVLNDAQLAESTMGRIKEALGKRGVTAEQRGAVEKLLTPKRLAALKRYEAGEVRAMPYWFNKEHIFEGKTFRISDLVDSEDVVEARRLVHGVRSDLETWTTKEGVKQADELHHFKANDGKLSNFADAKPFVDQFGDVWDAELMHNIGVIGDFERSQHALTEALGDAAPAMARTQADEFAAAAARADQGNASNIARNAEQIEAKSALDQATSSVAAPSPAAAVTDVAPAAASGDTVAAKVADQAAEVLPSSSGSSLSPGAVNSNVPVGAPPAAVAGNAGGIADAAGVWELLSSMEGMGLPSLAAIPIVGPVLAPFLKLRAAAGIFKRLGGRIPASAETTIAGKAAATRNKVRAAVGSFLEGGARTSGKAARLAPRPAVQALAHVQYDDGQQREKVDSKDSRALLAARSREINRAVGDEVATRRRVAEQVRTSDPALASALADRFMAKQQFLSSKLPRDPRNATPFTRPDYKPSQAEVEKFARFVHYADNPADVFEDLAAGRVNLEAVETVKAVYPDLYQDAQRATLELLAERGGDIDYKRRVQLSMVFDVVGDETLTPEYIAAMQATNPPAAPPAQTGNPPQSGISGDPRRMVDSYQTSFDRRAV